jgi:hypothetical protein
MNERERDAAARAALEPDPEFAAHLEWQIRTAARRENRFARPAAPNGWRVLRAAATILLALGLGASGVLAMQRVQQSREAALRSESFVVRRQLAAAKVADAEARTQELRNLVAAGQVSTEEQAEFDAELARLRREMAIIDLQLQEVELTGKEPEDRLSAPLVDGRDFVSERLELEREALEDQRAAASARRDHMAKLYERGLAPSSEMEAANAPVEQLATRIGVLEQRLALRQSFLSGGRTAAQVERQAQRDEAQADLTRAEKEVATANAVLKRVRELSAAGAVSSGDLRAAELSVAQAERAARLARLQLELLEGAQPRAR